jgi:hypothetical protein
MFGLACSTIMDDDSPRKLKCFDLPGGPYTDLVLIEHRHGVMTVGSSWLGSVAGQLGLSTSGAPEPLCDRLHLHTPTCYTSGV